jgi:small subunit ribosomal protein S1
VQAKIIELDKNRNNVVLSRRAYLEETQKETRDQFLNNLKTGEVREGTVSSVVSFGAFVDLGGMDGLIHVSELSWKHVDHPGSVVTVGDKVKVQVLDVDMSRERISLSLKATQADPWQEFAETHEVGQLVYGRVTKLVQFGAFVQVGDGIEGLVHISEMSAHHVDSPEQVVTPGEELWVKIIDLDLARRRISLSIKQAAEGGELAAEYREHFEIDSEGNWATSSDEVEAAWAEFEQADAGTELVEGAAPAENVADAGEAAVDETAVDDAAVDEAAADEAAADEVAVDEAAVDEA